MIQVFTIDFIEQIEKGQFAIGFFEENVPIELLEMEIIVTKDGYWHNNIKLEPGTQLYVNNLSGIEEYEIKELER